MHNKYFNYSKFNDENCVLPYFKEKYPGQRCSIDWQLTPSWKETWDWAGIDFWSVDPYPSLDTSNVDWMDDKRTFYDSKYKYNKRDIEFVVNKYFLFKNKNKPVNIKTDIYFYVYQDIAFTINRKMVLNWIANTGKNIEIKSEDGVRKNVAVITPEEIIRNKRKLGFVDCSDFIDKYKDKLAGYSEFTKFYN